MSKPFHSPFVVSICPPPPQSRPSTMVPNSPQHVTLLILILITSITVSASDCSQYQQTNPLSESEKWRGESRATMRHMFSATAIDEEKIVLFGGISAAGGRNQVAVDEQIHVYDTKSDTLSLEYPVINFNGRPKARFGQTAWAWKGSLYIYGGFIQDYSNEMWRLDYKGFDGANMNSTWRPVNATSSSPTTLGSVYGHTTTAVHASDSLQVLISFGGITTGGTGTDELTLVQLRDTGALGVCKATLVTSTDACAEFVHSRVDTESSSSTPDLSLSSSTPSARSAHTAASSSLSFCTYIYGGYDPISGDIYGDLWRLCPDGLSASSIGGEVGRVQTSEGSLEAYA